MVYWATDLIFDKTSLDDKSFKERDFSLPNSGNKNFSFITFYYYNVLFLFKIIKRLPLATTAQ